MWKWGEGKRGGGVVEYKEDEGGHSWVLEVLDSAQPLVGKPEKGEDLWGKIQKEDMTPVLKL